jgi:LPXTG-motif cell wall-anchored protein
MRRIHILIAAFAVAAILVPSASASGGALPYPHPRTADAKTGDTDSSWGVVAGTLAGVCLLFGAGTVLPRRHRRPVTA